MHPRICEELQPVTLQAFWEHSELITCGCHRGMIECVETKSFCLGDMVGEDFQQPPELPKTCELANWSQFKKASLLHFWKVSWCEELHPVR